MPRWCATIRPMGRLNRMRTPKQELRRGPLCSSSHCSPRFAGRGRCMCPPAPARRTMRRRQASPRRSLQLVFPCLPFSRFGRWDWPTRFEEDSAHAENGKHYLKHPSQNVDAKRNNFWQRNEESKNRQGQSGEDQHRSGHFRCRKAVSTPVCAMSSTLPRRRSRLFARGEHVEARGEAAYLDHDALVPLGVRR